MEKIRGWPDAKYYAIKLICIVTPIMLRSPFILLSGCTCTSIEIIVGNNCPKKLLLFKRICQQEEIWDAHGKLFEHISHNFVVFCPTLWGGKTISRWFQLCLCLPTREQIFLSNWASDDPYYCTLISQPDTNSGFWNLSLNTANETDWIYCSQRLLMTKVLSISHATVQLIICQGIAIINKYSLLILIFLSCRLAYDWKLWITSLTDCNLLVKFCISVLDFWHVRKID